WRQGPFGADVGGDGGVQNTAVQVVVEAAALPTQVGGQGQAVGRAPVQTGDSAPDGGLCRTQAGQLRRGAAAVDAGVGGRQGGMEGQTVADGEAAVDLHAGRLDHARVLALAQNAAGRDEAGAGKGPRAFADGDVDDGVLDAVP